MEFIKRRWYLIVIGLGVVILTVYGMTKLMLRHGEEEIAKGPLATQVVNQGSTEKSRVNIQLDALIDDSSGISLDTGFFMTIPSECDLSLESARENLMVTPHLDYELSALDNGFMITPKTNMISDKVYNFRLKIPERNINASWAFQTRRSFQILSTLPADKGTYVPVNSGIEFNFSHSGVKAIESSFSIGPKVNGRFEYHQNTVIFVPESLEYNTVYTVSLAKGIRLEGSNETLLDDYSFTFQTEKPPQEDSNYLTYLDFYQTLFNFPSDMQPFLQVGASEDLINTEMEVIVYRYEDTASFLDDLQLINIEPAWTVVDKDRLMPDVSGLTSFMDFKTRLTVVEDPFPMLYLSLPEAAPEGYYLVVMRTDTYQDYAYLQVNDMQLFLSVGQSSTLVWANDMITGEPIQDAICQVQGIDPVSTAKDGTGLINHTIFKDLKARYAYFSTTREGHPPLISEVSNSGLYRNQGADTTDQKNWTLLYFDRSAYLPTDTINVWGVIKPRDSGRLVQNATLELVANLYDSTTYTSHEVIMESVDAKVGRMGNFSSAISFENLASGSYSIRVMVNGNRVSERYFYINTYVKPQTRLTVIPSHLAILSDETVDVDVNCEFYEGTPVAGLALYYSAQAFSEHPDYQEGHFYLDEQGKAQINLKFDDSPTLPISWGPIYQSLYINNDDPEDTENYSQAWVYTFPRNVMVTVEGKIENTVAQIRFNTHKITIDTVRESGELYDETGEPAFIGSPVDRKLKATLYERHWDKRITGEYYDIINKKTVQNVEYFEVNNPIKSFEINTVGGMAGKSLSIPDYSDQNYYYIHYETVDMKNRPIGEDVGIGNAYYDYYYENYYIQFNKDDRRYAPGENIEMTLVENRNEDDTKEPGRILYMTLQEGIQDYWVTSEKKQSIPYLENYIPNIYVQAVYFDGRKLHVTNDSGVYFDTTAKDLEITAKTEKTDYQPGDLVTVDFTVRDQNGKPAKAALNLSVVDEAYFTLFEQDESTIESLYKSSFSSGIYQTFISYMPYNSELKGAEGAEGGDVGNVRQDFVDTVYFGSTETDSSGKATLSFKLPDNLTSWRLSYQAVTEDLEAGNGKIAINTKLPYFIKLSNQDLYLEGDSPVILLKSFGYAISPDDTTEYEVLIEGQDGSKKSINANGISQRFTEVKLPKLAEGLYTLTAKAACNNYKDSVAQVFRVEKSILEASTTEYFRLSNNLKLDSKGYGATLRFYNAGLSDYHKALTELYGAWGNRVDQVLARNMAAQLLDQYFYEGYDRYTEPIDLSSWQRPDGGMAILPYGSSDVELSVKIASLALDKVDQTRLRNYLLENLEDSSTPVIEMAAAYWGLAVLRDPVLNDIRALLKSSDLITEERLYLALGLAELGDFGGAEAIYTQVVSKYQKELGTYRYLNTGGDKESTLQVTALCAMLALKIDTADKMAFFGYIENNASDEILINLERMIYAKSVLPYTSNQSSFTMAVNGKEQDLVLDGTVPYMTLVKATDMDSIQFSSIKGDIMLAISYKGKASAPDKEDQIANINRSYLVKDKTTTLIERSDYVMVQLVIDFKDIAPSGNYAITDVLPSGLRFLAPNSMNLPEWFFEKPEGKLVQAGFYYSGGSGRVIVTYSARVTAPGDYTADKACVLHLESNTSGYSDQSVIMIQ